jgi:hypothetical protein
MQWNIRRYHVLMRRRSHQAECMRPPQPSGLRPITTEVIQGHEWSAYVTLDTSMDAGMRDRLPGASPMATEPP